MNNFASHDELFFGAIVETKLVTDEEAPELYHNCES